MAYMECRMMFIPKRTDVRNENLCIIVLFFQALNSVNLAAVVNSKQFVCDVTAPLGGWVWDGVIEDWVSTFEIPETSTVLI